MTSGKAMFNALARLCAESLKPGEVWCVIDPNGKPIVETGSQDFTEPVRLFCDALDIDWDDATDQGFRLNVVKP